MKTQQQKKPRGERTIEIIAITLVVVIIAIIAIPNIVDNLSGPIASEASVISALRTLSSAQELYKTRFGCYGDYFNLYGEKKPRFIDPTLAKADPDHPEHTDRQGCDIDISVNADNTDWCAFCIPAKWGEDEYRNLKIGSDGVIRYNQTEGDTTNFPYILGSS